ncbi:putative UPF0481 protein At3g02645 isoform X2 [Solanum dulcamara]|uniref:putative UPF0481 protein At3g02645 isoform X2 n=1 Tax=Solanum dulcamara TaxID=45834 RepID=UPI0024863107|nr:putative UPF0481 protein At3g02645 isoform X2 [Solanum dulcamara]XP_055800572.1 putative UPF0481 protein At3g02645 isoform X2 [Solanum dulcamara]
MTHSIEITPIVDQIPLLHQIKKDEIEEARKVDHLKETNDQHTNKSANQIIDEKLKDLDKGASIKFTSIFKVNVGLRKSNPDAYAPMLISIGPYHKKNPQLGSMEKYKLMYLRRFLQRKKGLDVESCITEIEKLKRIALKCYDDIESLDNDIVDKFSEILLLDGCFVVEFIRECNGMLPNREDKIISTNCMINLARRDLLLLENQLPYFVLTKLQYMTKEVDEVPFTKLVKDTFFSILPKMAPASYVEWESDAKNIKHLLQVVHMLSHPSYWDSFLRITACSGKMILNKDYQTWHANIPNVTELCEAGVRFSKVGNIYSDLEDRTTLFDIKFESGQMKIPCFEVDDVTETLLRNLVAYEQQSCGVLTKHFSDYAVFMDYLIHSDKDVNVLRQKGIITNQLGEDNEVASIFNKIGQGVNISSDFYYKEECRKVIQHCEKPWNRMKANLRHNYFNTPWAGISTVAAIILLLLTATQTVLTFVSLFK